MLENKVIMVTGASRGIGRAVAECYATNGATVILLSRTINDLNDVHDAILAAGSPQPMICPFNLCSATLEDYDELRCKLTTQYGKLDGLVHNAGILGSLAPIEHYNIQHWYQVLQVNLNSAFILTQALLPLLKLSNTSSIIFTLNKLASEPKANWGAYAVANAGCNVMMQMLAAECAKISNVRVNAVTPDKVQTRLRAAAYPAEAAELNLPDSVTAQYLHLMSDAAEQINGVNVQVL